MILLAVLMLVVALLVLRRRRNRRPSSPRRRSAVVAAAVVVAIQALIGAPASAQSFDCKEAPNPERPGTGMVGAIDPAPLGYGHPDSAYFETGYAGHVWHTYDLGCGPQGVTNPNALVDTWVGNEMFNIGKNLVGATNGLHYALLTGSILAPLDDVVATGTAALYDSVFTPAFGVVALLLAVLLFRYIWQGDLATIGKRGMWALAGLWLASATYLTPLLYTHALDDLVIKGTSAVQAGFLREVGVDERNALPTVLHDQVVYRNWAQGEFGSPDSPQAQQYGRELLRAQAWTKLEMLQGADGGSPEPKKQAFEEVAGKLGSTYGYFQGVDGSRIGAGILSMVQGFAFASFQLLAKAAILLAQVMLRVLILAGPLIGLVALIQHDILRVVGKLAGSTMLNVVMISAMAGMHSLVLTWIFDPTRGFSVLTQILLSGLMTLVFLMVGKPVRRMTQMVELSVGRSGTGEDSRGSTSIFSRFRGRSGEQQSQDGFWNQVRSSDQQAEDQAKQGGGWRSRPEAEYDSSVNATAQRLDREGHSQALPSSAPRGSADRVTPALPVSGANQTRRPGQTSTSEQGVPEGRSSRVVDTAPVADARWDGVEEDPVLVPSRRGAEAMPGPAEPPTPRRTDMEVVSGKPVNVVYRPSRGLEVGDGG